jgi:Fe2+ or Zn2+ uptake regulation protein
MEKQNKYHWVCDECGKDGEFEHYEWETVVVRCPYCRGLNITTTKVKVKGK